MFDQGAWSLNIDVKKLWFNTDADINNGALKRDVDLDARPLMGFGRRF